MTNGSVQYGGDIVATAEAFVLSYDMGAFYEKVVNDFFDSQRLNGGFTETSPYVGLAMDGLGDDAGSIDWGSAAPLVTWWLYEYYGNRRLLSEGWPLFERWMKLVQARLVSLAVVPCSLIRTAFLVINLIVAIFRLTNFVHEQSDLP
jgi:alpha-L-rhamnosidase